MTKPKL